MAPKYRLFDAHIHLQDQRLRGCVARVLSEARSRAGVENWACNGCCERDWPQVQELARKHPEVVPNYGLHPWFIQERSEQWLQTLRDLLESQPEAGLGECGLDRSQRASHLDFDEQISVMTQQIRLAAELQRPVSVHCVRAFGKMLEVVQQEGPFPHGFVLHSWAGNVEQVKAFCKIEGCSFSISGHTMSLPSRKARPMLQQIPLEKLLVETDAPDGKPNTQTDIEVALPEPPPDSSRLLNHPGNIRVVVEYVAEMTGQDTATIAAATYDNASQIFCVPSRALQDGECCH